MGEQAQDYQSTDRQVRPTAGKGVIFVLLLIVIVAVLGYFVLQNRSLEGPFVPGDRPVPISVETVQVTLDPAYRTEEKFTGLVTPRRTSQLGFSSGGRIAAIRADIGDKVEPGTTLAVLDTRGLQAQLASAEAMVEEARAAFQLASTTVDRQIALLERGHVSSQIVDEARAQSNTAYARIDAAKANADALRVQIDLARIKAPFAGTITNRMSDEGAIASSGQPVFELVETSVLEAQIGLTEALASRLVIGEIYQLVSDRGSTDAVLRSVTGVIDPASRTVAAQFDIVDPTSVSSGAVVRLGMEREIEEPGLWLPVSALAEADRGLWSVYAVRREQGGWVAAPGIVEILYQDGDRVFIRGALRDGDRVIIDGLQRITPGQPVTPVEVTAADNGSAR